MFNRSRGMIWYRIFQFVLMLWILIALAHAVVGPEVDGISSEDLRAALPFYFNFYRACSFVRLILYVFLFYSMFRYSQDMVRWCRVIIIASLILPIAQMLIFPIVYDVPLVTRDIYVIIANVTPVYIFLIPTYIYLKRRWPSKIAASSSNINLTEPFDPFAEVPAKLMGHTDQAERDRIIADVMHGHPNPYTGFTISNEADWNTYLTMYYERKDAASIDFVAVPPEPCTPIDSVAPVSLSKNPPQTIDSDEVSMPQAEPQPEPKQIRFCRFCGNALHDDSIYCDKCGKKVRS